MATARTKTDDAVTGEGEFTCDCGRTFTHGAWYSKHKLKCDGVAPATSGRIAARAGTAAIAVALPVSRPQLMGQNRKRRNGRVHRTPPAAAAAVVAIAAAATDKAMEIVIAGLLAKRTAIDNAIAALQAVA